jgi:hypothetical protein
MNTHYFFKELQMIHATSGFMRNLRTVTIFMAVLFGLNACDNSDSAQSVAAITGQPTDQSVVASTAATFTVVATGATGYQWQSSTDSGSTFSDVSGATSASYTTAVTTLGDSGMQYRVVVTGASNSVTSSAVTLTVTSVADAPAITVQPAHASVTAPAIASFSVTATGTNLNYQWQQCQDSNETCASWSDLSGAIAATYATGATDVSMTGQRFRVVVSNTEGSLDSAVVSLNVDPTPVAPVITSQPVDAAVVAPATASFTVAFTSVPAILPLWQYSNDGSNWFNLGVLDNTYTTAATSTGDDGRQFRAILENAAGSVTTNVVTLTVTDAASAPSFTTQPADVTITEGQNAQFTVAITGAPTPTLQWQLSTDSGSNWSNINGETGSVFNVSNAALANNGRQFRAVASNSEGTVNSDAAVLTVTSVQGKTFGTATVAATGKGGPFAMNSSGNAVSLWVEIIGSDLALRANYYTASLNTWNSAVTLSSTGTVQDPTIAENPAIAINATGDAVAVWQQHDGTRSNIWANQFTGGSWGTATVIESGSGSAVFPQVAIDDNGHAMAVWAQDGTSIVMSNRYVPGTGWENSASAVDIDNFGASPRIVMDSSGNAVAVWSKPNGIAVNRYTVGSGWGSYVVIGTDSPTNSTYHSPRIAINANGDAIAVWLQNGSSRNVMANRYTTATGWGTAGFIEWAGGDANSPQIALDSNGNAMAVWAQAVGGGNPHIWTNRYTLGSGWDGFPADVQIGGVGSGNTAMSSKPDVAFDSTGNALVVWSQSYAFSSAPADIWVNRYTAGSGWGTTVDNVLAQINITGAGGPGAGSYANNGSLVAFDANDNAMVVWGQDDGDGAGQRLWFNLYQ